MSECILDMHDVTVGHTSGRHVLTIERLTLYRGELIAIIGPNGAGKSTLLQTVNLLHPYRGTMQLFGQDAQYADKTMLRRRSAMVFQETMLLHDTVFRNVALALRFRGEAAGTISDKVRKALADVHCSHLASRPAYALSGGEKQRVCIARALVSSPELLLLDEPFASLDAVARSELLEEIRMLAEARNITVMLVSHHFTDVLHFAERAIMIFDGRIVQDDKPELIMRRPVNEAVARLVGMDNIIPCRIEQNGTEQVIWLANGLSFHYVGKVTGPGSVCCLPGDSFALWNESDIGKSDPRIMVEGRVERVTPGIGSYRILVQLGEGLLCARIPRSQLAGDIQRGDMIELAFNPAEVHIM